MGTATDQRTWDGRAGDSPVGGAPISWGACEVPGWGPMPDTETVLTDMAALGLLGTELGAPGFLPRDPAALAAVLRRHELRFIGSFVPLVLHESDPAPALEAARRTLELLRATGGEVLIGAVVQDLAWSAPRPLDPAGWRRLGDNAARVAELAAHHGIAFALHPHVGTLILHADDVDRALEATAATAAADAGAPVGWCLDTGHLMIGGVDPAAFARDHGDRVAHAHLKDVDARLAAEVRAGTTTLIDATRRGLFTVLGSGSARVGETLHALSDHGYDGWLVLEQDTTLDTTTEQDTTLDTTTDDAGSDAAGDAGPTGDARQSIAFLNEVTRRERSSS